MLMAANDSATSSNTNETPELKYNKISSGTPLSGVSFSDFNGMTESGLGILLGLPQYAAIDAGKAAELLALKAQLNQQMSRRKCVQKPLPHYYTPANRYSN